MKKMLKLSIVCIGILVITAMVSTLSFAAEDTVDLNALLNADNSNSETTNTPEITDIEEENTENSQNNNSQGNNSTENSNESGNSAEGSNAESSSTENNNTDSTNNTVNTVTDDNKLPQTGEKENMAIIILAVFFGALAIIAYKQVKKYNIK